MSAEVALLNEVWEIVKSTIPAKERVHVAESLIRCFEDHVDISDIDMYKNEFDKVMKAALLSHFSELDDDADDEEDWE